MRLTGDQTRRFNDLSKNLVPDFHLILDELYLRSNKNLGFLFSAIMSRNPYVSNFYFFLVQISFVDNELKINPYTEIRVYSSCVHDVLSRKWPSVKVRNMNKFDTFYKNFSVFYNLLKIFVIVGAFLLDNIFFKRSNYYLDNKAKILLDIFWDKSMFINDKYHDRYYGNFLNYLSKKEKEMILFCPHLVDVRHIGFVRKRSNSLDLNVIYKHNFLTLWDFCSIILRLFRSPDIISKTNRKALLWNNFDISEVIRYELNYSNFNTSTFYALCNYYFVASLKSSGFSGFELFINWFENQPIDRGLNKGFHDFYPKTKTKGYQGFVVSFDFNFYLSPTSLEDELGLIPQQIITCGEGLITEVKRYNENLRVSYTSAFRFEHVWLRKIGKVSDNFRVLVVLPFIKKEAKYLIRFLLTIANEKILGDVVFSLRLHPDLCLRDFNSIKGMFPPNVVFDTDVVDRSIYQSQLIIGNTSSLITEALASGLRAIIIPGSDGFVQNPIPRTVEISLWKVVYSSQELLNEILHYKSIQGLTGADTDIRSESIKKQYFEPVTRNHIKNFIKC